MHWLVTQKINEINFSLLNLSHMDPEFGIARFLMKCAFVRETLKPQEFRRGKDRFDGRMRVQERERQISRKNARSGEGTTEFGPIVHLKGCATSEGMFLKARA